MLAQLSFEEKERPEMKVRGGRDKTPGFEDVQNLNDYG
jgi:hypothetical protein